MSPEAPSTHGAVRVVVGVPAYRSPDGAVAAVTAILAQAVSGLAVVVVDDDPEGSTAAALATATKDSRLRVTTNPRRLGLAGNWQRTLEVAMDVAPAAEYFAWASDHDRWAPGWLGPLVDGLDDDPGAVMACGRALWMRSSRSGRRPVESRVVSASGPSAVARVRAVLADGDAGAMIYGLIRVSALRRTAGFRNVLLPDRLIISELAILGRVLRVETSAWGRVRHAGGRSRQRAAFFPEGAPRRSYLPPRAFHGVLLAWDALCRRGAVATLPVPAGLVAAWLVATTTPGGIGRRLRKRGVRLRRRVPRLLPRGTRLLRHALGRRSTESTDGGGRPLRVLVALNDSFVRNVENAVGAMRADGHEVILSVPRRGDGEEMDSLCARIAGLSWGRAPKPRSADARLRWRLLAFADAAWYQGWLGDPTVGHQRRRLERVGLSLERQEQPRRAVAVRRALVLRWLAGRVRADSEVRAWLRSIGPDVVVIVPGVSPKRPEAEVAAAAAQLGIPLVSAIASWDNLTTKGMLRPGPTRFLVWGAAQKDEAVRLHRVSPNRVCVVGAHTYDHWLRAEGEVPSRAAALAGLGLGERDRYVVWLGSAPLVEQEEAVVERWLIALSESTPFSSGAVTAVVRSHPQRVLDGSRFTERPGVRLVVRNDALPVGLDDKRWYRGLLTHAAAVVGINTSAMWEAAVHGCPVLSFETGNPGQRITHARYLHGSTDTLLGEHLPTLREHVAELEACIAGSSELRERESRGRAFVRAQIASPDPGAESSQVFSAAVAASARLRGGAGRRLVVGARHPLMRLATGALLPPLDDAR